METEQFAAVYERARRDWPGVDVPMEPFARHLEEVAFSPVQAEHAGALYLCTGCALGIPAAVRALEKTEFPRLRATLVGVAGQRHLVDDLLQEVRSRLLVGTPAKIWSYRGTGPLASWLRVIANRVALDYWRTQSLQRGRLRALEQHIATSAESKGRSACDLDDRRSRELEHSLAQAIVALSAEDKQFLRHYFVARVSIDVLGRMFGCDRSTAARRLQRAVDRIRQGVRRRITAQLPRPSEREVDELLACSIERIDFDLGSWLNAPVGPAFVGSSTDGEPAVRSRGGDAAQPPVCASPSF
jgi:RNA polymerase sigma-70 factor, ECF subfamily